MVEFGSQAMKSNVHVLSLARYMQEFYCVCASKVYLWLLALSVLADVNLFSRRYKNKKLRLFNDYC